MGMYEKLKRVLEKKYFEKVTYIVSLLMQYFPAKKCSDNQVNNLCLIIYSYMYMYIIKCPLQILFYDNAFEMANSNPFKLLII